MITFQSIEGQDRRDSEIENGNKKKDSSGGQELKGPKAEAPT